MKHSKLTKALLLALALVMVLSMAACGGNSSGSSTSSTTPADSGSSTPANSGNSAAGAILDTMQTTGTEEANTDKSDETVTVMLAAEPTALTGLTGITDQEACVIEYATSAHLFDFDTASGTAVPSLATGYEAVDETHYRVSLRADAHYSDGSPITAADVIYTFKTCYDAGQEWALNFALDECVAEDEHTVLLAFTQYVPGWDAGLSEATAGIFSEAAVNAIGGLEATERNLPVSGGRYNFNEWKPGEYILLERNDNYWDPDYVGYYKFIKVIWASDSASRTLAVKSGDADVAETLSVSECLTLQNDPSASPVIFPSSTTFNVYFNCSKEPFSDPKLREACSYLIDSVGMNQLVNMGLGEVAQGFIPKQMGEFYKEYHPDGVNPYDVEKAKTLLAEAGYGDGLTVECVILKANLAPATVIQEAFRNAGITMNITTMEPGSFVPEARAGNYDITIGNNSNGFRSPDNFKLVNPESAYTVIGGPKITDEAMIEIVKRGNSFDHDTAVQGWHDCIDYLFSNHCLVGLYSKLICEATNPNIAGLKLIKREYINITELHPAA